VVVKFLGYGNEESVWLKDLLPSKGTATRQEQAAAAAAAGITETVPAKSVEESPSAVSSNNVGLKAVLDEKQRLEQSNDILRTTNLDLYAKVAELEKRLTDTIDDESAVAMENMTLYKKKVETLTERVRELEAENKLKDQKMVSCYDTSLQDSKVLLAKVERLKQERDQATKSLAIAEAEFREIRSNGTLNSSVEEVPRTATPSPVHNGGPMMANGAMAPMMPPMNMMYPMMNTGDQRQPMMMCMMPVPMSMAMPHAVHPAAHPQQQQTSTPQKPVVPQPGTATVNGGPRGVPLRRPFTNPMSSRLAQN